MKTLNLILLIFAISLFLGKIYAQEMEVNIQKGHLGAVKIAAFSPNGKFLVTGGRDKTAKLWEISSGREVRTFIGHEATVQALRFSIDGKYIATGSIDESVKLWNIETGELIRTYTVKDRVTTIDFTSDGKYIVIGGEEFKAYIFETETGNIVRNFDVDPNKGTGTGIQVDISQDNKNILVSEDNREAVVIDFETGKQINELKSVEEGSCGGCGTFAKYLPDENFIIMGSHNGPLVLWNVNTGKIIKTYIEKQEEVSSVDVSFDGKIILISDEFSVSLYHKDTGKRISSTKAHEKNINFAGFSPDANSYITVSDDGTAVLRKTSSGKEIMTFEGYINQSDQGTNLDQESYREYYARTYFDRKTNVKLSPDGKMLIIGKKDSIAKVLDFETGRTLYNLKGHSAAVICFDFSPDSKLIATGSSDKTIKLWNSQTGQLIKTFKGHDNMIFSVNFNQDGTKLLSAGWDGNAFLWDINSDTHENYYKNVKAFTSDFSKIGNYIITGGLDKIFSLWEIDSKEMFRQFVGHTDVVSSFDLTEDGRTLLSGSWDGSICVWDFISGFQLKKINTGQSQIHSVLFSENGKYLFSGGADGNIKMWETGSGKLVKTFVGHNSTVTSLQITPDNQSLISCSIDGTVIIWEIVNSKIIYTYYQLTRDDWFVKSRGGFFDGNAGAKKYIFFVKGMETFGVDQFFEDFYRPGLLQQAYQTKGLINENMNLNEYLKKSPPPVLHFKTNLNDSVVKTDIAAIEFELTDNGGGIDEIKVMHNGKRIIHDYKSTGNIKRGKKTYETIEILLIPGENIIEVSAFSEGRIESSVIEQTILFESNEYLPNCHILIIGIDQYENETLNLNYAKADAKAFSEMIKKRSKLLFNHMNFYNLYDDDAKKLNIITAVNEISKNSKPEDVFIFYYAGHGSMIEDKFYFIPTDCIRLYDSEIAENNAISADLMQENFKKIKALKQIMILDACQSGGATEILGQRGAGREKAIAQLSRSAGIHVLASAGSEQFATEFKSLGHGLFTYVLIDALNGNADGSPLDGKITIYELKSYLDDQVPEYTKKFKGIRQYPQSYSGGNDFPLIVLSDN